MKPMLEQILADKSLTLGKLAERLSMTVEETKQFVKEMRQKGYRYACGCRLTEGGGMKRGMFALGRLKTGQMNKTESEYAQHLEWRKRAGEIAWYRFEGMKFRLADNTFYMPDFSVMRSDGVLEMHEVKGYWMDDAKVKIKVAAEQYPMAFVAVRKKAKKEGGGWEIEHF